MPSEPAEIRVLLVDDHPPVRAGLRALLKAEADLDVVGDAPNVTAGIALAQREQADVVVLDLSMPGVHGPQAVDALARACPDVRILVLSGEGTVATVQDCLRAGANGYLLKTAETPAIADAIRRVHRGAHAIDGDLAVELVAGTTAQLTERELDVLKAVSEGLTNRQAAARLGVTENTVKTHVASVLQKLQAHDRTHAVAMLLRRGLLR